MPLFLKIIEIILTALYILSAVAYVRDFISSTRVTATICRVLAILTLVWHLFFFSLIGGILGRYPVSNFFEFLSALALGLLLIYMYLELRFLSFSMGALVLSFAALAQTVSAIHPRHPGVEGLNPAILNPLFIFHQVNITLAFASLLISAIFSLMYLLLHKSLKHRKFDIFFERFPSLAVLGEMNYQALLAGVIFLTLNIPFSFAMVYIFNEGKWDFQYCMFFTYFLVYAFGVILGLFWKWRGKRLAFYSLTSLIVLIMATGAAKFLTVRHLWF